MTKRTHDRPSLPLPQTKAQWLLAHYYPDDVPFPLDPGLVSRMPAYLTGHLPTNEMELYVDPAETTSTRPQDGSIAKRGRVRKARTASTDKPQRFLLLAGMPSDETFLKLYRALTGKEPTPEQIEALHRVGSNPRPA